MPFQDEGQTADPVPDNTRMIEALPDGPLYGSYRGKTAGKFIGLNPKGWGPLTLHDCQCGACRMIRAACMPLPPV